MGKFTIRLLTLTIYATALVMIPIVAPAKASTSSSKHLKHKKKIQMSHGVREPWSAGQAGPAGRPSSQPGATCSRGFECEKWPPPMYEDPQRNPDGGGM